MVVGSVPLSFLKDGVHPPPVLSFFSWWLLQQLRQPVWVHPLLPVAPTWKTPVPSYFGYTPEIAVKTISVGLHQKPGAVLTFYTRTFADTWRHSLCLRIRTCVRIRTRVRTHGDRAYSGSIDNTVWLRWWKCCLFFFLVFLFWIFYLIRLNAPMRFSLPWTIVLPGIS